MKRSKKIKYIVLSLVAVIICLVFVTPMYAVIMTSLKSSREANVITLGPPAIPQWENYTTAIKQGKLVSSFVNSLVYSIGSVAPMIVLVMMGGFVINRRKTKSTQFFYYFILLGLAIPASNVTLVQIMKFLHLINTKPGVILIYMAMNIPLSLFLCSGFLGSIPREIDEAAIIDGCGPFSLFFRVIFPLLKPIMATLFVLNTMSVWNDFMMPIYFLNNSRDWPMTLAIFNFFGRYSQDWQLVCADVVMTTAPILVIFILGQKYIVGGLTAGSVKS